MTFNCEDCDAVYVGDHESAEMDAGFYIGETILCPDCHLERFTFRRETPAEPMTGVSGEW